jgi:hypothetical protein
MDVQDLKETIEDWYQLKRRLNDLEKRIDQNRDKIIKYMDENNVDTVLTEDLIVKRIDTERESISKKDIPADLWSKYSKKTKSHMYRIQTRKD